MTIPKDTVESTFTKIINDISENGVAASRAIKGRMSFAKFYELLSSDEEKAKRYTRATEMRAELIADETIEIADGEGRDLIILPDGREVEDQRVIQRDRLRVDTRKWLLAKLHPKKYGDSSKMDLTTNGKEIALNPVILTKEEVKRISEQLNADC